MRPIRIISRDYPKTGAHSMHDLRVCNACHGLVDRWNTSAHRLWHQDNDREAEPEPEPLEDPGGYVVGGPGWHVSQITGGEASE
jgi:hypothetical protein